MPHRPSLSPLLASSADRPHLVRHFILSLVLLLAATASAQTNRSPSQLAGSSFSTFVRNVFPAGQITFTFTLPESKMTSAGVYLPDGTKIRDLWGGRRLAEGTYTETWDGLDDDGNVMPPGEYTIKLLHHNIWFSYSNLFNSGAHPTGPGAYFQFRKPMSVRSSSNALIWFCGYNEAGTTTFKSTVSEPTTFQFGVPSLGTNWAAADGAADSTHAYIAVGRNHYWSTKPQDSYLMKFSVQSNQFVRFTGLAPDSYDFQTGNGPARANYRGIALSCGLNSSISDFTYSIAKVAVMQSGRLVAVSQPNANRILFFDKTTGMQARPPIQVEKPTAIVWTKGDSHLIVASKNTVLRAYRDAGSTMILTASQDKRSFIVDLALDPTSGHIAAALAGASQQVVGYNTNLAERWRLGQQSGYASTAIVSPTRFHFLNNAQGGSLTFQPDGKLWVYDTALYRMQRFPQPATSTAVDQTMHIGASYSFAADKYDPSRLVANFYLGYRRDWTKSNRPGFGGQGAWVLDRFWGYNYVDRSDPDAAGGITHIFTIAARTFGTIDNNLGTRLVELTSNGIRDLGPSHRFYGMNDDFDRFLIATAGTILKEPFVGFNSNGVPTWGPAVPYASYSPQNLTDPIPTPGQGTPEYPNLDNDIVTAYHALDQNLNRYHIGLLRPNGTWKWKHARPQPNAVPFPRNGNTTTLGNEYACVGAFAKDDFAILSWNGEFYLNGQAGQHLLYNRDGLYVSQLGHVSEGSLLTEWYPAVGTNGNALHAALFIANSKYRYLHSTESQISGVHEWTFENTDSMDISQASGPLFSSLTLPTIESLGTPLAPPGPSVQADNFNRANSNSLGLEWTKLDAFDGSEIKNNALAAKDNLYDVPFRNIAYRSTSQLDSCQRISIAPSFFSPNAFGHISPTGFSYLTGLVARLNPATRTCVLGLVSYTRLNNAPLNDPSRNGHLKLDIWVNTPTRRYSLGGASAFYLPPSPGHAYSLRFTVHGTAPTKLEAVLYDDTIGRELLRDYTETWDPLFEQPGYSGISLGMSNVQIDSWQSMNFSWPLP